MKLYIAGPMSGYPNNNIDAFDQVAALMRLRGYEVVNPADLDQTLAYDELILRGLRDLAFCDAVATLGKWRASSGASAEVRYAKTRRMPVRHWFYWDFFYPLWAKHTPR